MLIRVLAAQAADARVEGHVEGHVEGSDDVLAKLWNVVIQIAKPIPFKRNEAFMNGTRACTPAVRRVAVSSPRLTVRPEPEAKDEQSIEAQMLSVYVNHYWTAAVLSVGGERFLAVWCLPASSP